jgi:alpha-maltose-1-phosphate synthase
MRVTLITLMDEGGMVHYTSQLSNHLAQKVDVTVIVPEGCDLAHFSEQVCIKTVKTPPKRGWLNKNNLQVWRLFCVISETEPDVIHLSGSHPWIFPLYPFLRIRRYPVVATVHDVKLHLGEATLVARLTNYVYIRSADHVFVHGLKLRNELVNAGIDNSKISVIPHGAYSFFTRANAGAEEDAVILFFGRIHPYKGLEYLLDAMPLILKELPNAQLIIAGRGDLAELQQRIQRSLNITVMNEFIPDDQVAELFERAAVVVLPYVEGSQTGVVPIAYSFKKPVIVTNVGSINEVVEDGKTGFIVPPRDAAAIADAVGKILTDRHQRLQMGENAYRKMNEEFSWDTVVRETVRVYTQITHGQKSRREDANK